MPFLEGEQAILNNLAKEGLPHRIGERCTVTESLLNSTNYDYLVTFDDGSIGKVKENELNKLTDYDKKIMEWAYQDNWVIHKSSGEFVKILKCDYLLNQFEILFTDHSNWVTDISSLKEWKEESDSVSELKFKVGDKVKATTKDNYNGFTGEVVDIEIIDGKHHYYTVKSDEKPAIFIEHELALIEKSKEDQPLEQGKFTKLGLEIGEFTDKKNKQYGSSVDATYKMVRVLMERYTYDDENYLMPKSLLQHLLLTVRVMDKENRIFNNPSGEGDSESPWRDICGYGLIGVEMTEK